MAERDTSGHVILLVEDNRDDVALTLRAFHRNGMLNKVVVARDGEEALDYLLAGDAGAGGVPADLPSLVLLDLKLPKVSGFEVLSAIRTNERTKLLPVVVLTSSAEECDLVDSYTLGANSCVRKPVDFAEFVEAVGRLGVYWLLVNESPPRPSDAS